MHNAVPLSLAVLVSVGIILVTGGRKATAFSVHGVTCAVMLFAGLWLIHAF
jgi:hypothetical protein